MIVISRNEALAQGLKRYFTGVACKNNHIAERTVSNFTCIECQKEKAKKDYEENPDKWINRRMDYYKNNKESERSKMKAYYLDNLEKQTAARKKRYYEKAEEIVLIVESGPRKINYAVKLVMPTERKR